MLRITIIKQVGTTCLQPVITLNKILRIVGSLLKVYLYVITYIQLLFKNISYRHYSNCRTLIL